MNEGTDQEALVKGFLQIAISSSVRDFGVTLV